MFWRVTFFLWEDKRHHRCLTVSVGAAGGLPHERSFTGRPLRNCILFYLEDVAQPWVAEKVVVPSGTLVRPCILILSHIFRLMERVLEWRFWVPVPIVEVRYSVNFDKEPLSLSTGI